MDMDLIVIFGFVATIVLIVTMGVVLFPISRKLGHFLEEAAKERAERLAGRAAAREALPGDVQRQIVHLLGNLEEQVQRLAERQDFTERLLERRAGGTGPESGPEEAGTPEPRP